MYDYIIINGLVVDGTGGSPCRKTVCIKGERIVEITDQPKEDAANTIDAQGKIVAPGFIDIHCHSDLTRRTDNIAENKLCQGVTLELAGNCGISIIPSPNDAGKHEEMVRNMLNPLSIPYTPDTCGIYDVADFTRFMETVKGPVHMGMLIGHNALRSVVMGYEKRDATALEMEQMKQLLDQMMRQGAFGLSLGLVYPPGIFCKTEELVQLATVVTKYHGMMTVHMRDESDRIEEALEEVFRVAGESGVHLHISHLKIMGKANWGKAAAVLEMIERARNDGLYITADQYPYDASSTTLNRLVPNWAHAGGTLSMLERLGNPELLPGIKEEMEQEIGRRGGPGCIRINDTGQVIPEIEDRTLDVIGEEWGMSGTEAAVEILLRCRGAVSCISHSISPADLEMIMRQRWICVGSDGMTYKYSGAGQSGKPHRRSFGTFPCFLQTVREKGLMPVEAAVYKISGCPAKAMALKDRGVLKAGNYADITIFDFNTIEDRSTYSAPWVRPGGIEYVFVSGEPAVWKGQVNGINRGRFILHEPPET